MTGRVHILRAGNRYRLVFVPSGHGRHLVESEDALRTFLLTDLEIPPGVTETAITELDRSGRYTIDNIRHGQDQEVLAAGHHDAAHATRAKPNAPALPEPAKRKSRRVIARGTRAKPKPPRKAKRKGRSGR